jgi:hypothetical protein
MAEVIPTAMSVTGSSLSLRLRLDAHKWLTIERAAFGHSGPRYPPLARRVACARSSHRSVASAQPDQPTRVDHSTYLRESTPSGSYPAYGVRECGQDGHWAGIRGRASVASQRLALKSGRSEDIEIACGPRRQGHA